jgi:hypothetical protein
MVNGNEEATDVTPDTVPTDASLVTQEEPNLEVKSKRGPFLRRVHPLKKDSGERKNVSSTEAKKMVSFSNDEEDLASVKSGRSLMSLGSNKSSRSNKSARSLRSMGSAKSSRSSRSLNSLRSFGSNSIRRIKNRFKRKDKDKDKDKDGERIEGRRLRFWKRGSSKVSSDWCLRLYYA